MSEGAAPSAGVADATATPGAGDSGSGSTQQPQAGTRADGRAIAPIRESLPGVVEVTEADEALAKLTGESARQARQERDQRGRFLKQPGAKAADGSPEQDSVKVPPKPGEEPKPERFKWAGEEWDSQEKAEQSFRTLRGQFRANEARARERDSAAHSATAWKAEHDRVLAELQAVKQGKVSPETGTTSEPSPEAGESIDWALYAEITKTAAERGQPEVATQWLAQEQERVMQARVEKLLSERLDAELAPVKEAEQIRYVEQHTNDLFASMAEYVSEDGSSAFPELQDEEQAADVGRLWHSLGLPPEQALTPQGAMSAVLMYRGYQAASNSANAANPAATPTAATSTPVVSDASTVIEEGVTVPEVGPDTYPGMTPEAARIAAALRRSGAHLTVPGLGFAR